MSKKVCHFGFVLILVALVSVPKGSYGQSCSCTEYIYVNEIFGQGNVHKFEVNSTGNLPEEAGANGIPWYPGATGISEFPNPHGLGYDRNGFLYIGEDFSNASIRRINCLGNIFPETGSNGFVTPQKGFLLSSVQSFDGFIFSNGNDNRIFKYDPCTGQEIGYIQLTDAGDNGDWGFFISSDGTFYNTTPAGRIYVYKPSAADFVSNTSFSPVLNLQANPGYGGLSPAYHNNGLQGITTDGAGNIYVVEGNRDVAGTTSRLLKFDSNLNFLFAGPLDTNAGDGGWNMMTGIAYSPATHQLYTTSISPQEDCVRRWNADDFNDNNTAVSAQAFSSGSKSINLISECCPTSETIEKSVCGVTPGARISLSELLTCEGIVCQGQWTAVQQDANLQFNDCDLTVTVNGLPGCGTYQITNTGLAGTTCPNYTITLNVKYLADIEAQVIAGDQTVCPTNDPVAFTVTTAAFSTPSGETITYQWQSSTTSATTGFSNISGGNSAIYDSGPVSQTTYFRVIASISGCTNGSCSDTSNVVTLTLGSNCVPLCNAPTPLAEAAERCGVGTVTLTASGCTTGYTATWYTNAGLTTPAPGTNTGNSYTTPSLTTTTSYWVACVETATPTCKSSGVEVVATIKPNPTITAGTPVCNEGGTAFEVGYTATALAVVTADKGTPGTNKFTGIASGETITMTATLNGCTAFTTATATCSIPCPLPNCGIVTVIKN